MSQPAQYYLPAPSYWPIVGSVSLFALASGLIMLVNHIAMGAYLLGIGALLLAVMLFGWFGAVISESLRGLYNPQVDRSFRWGMSWFIYSEVMFFAAFFGALFYARLFAVPWLGATPLLWPDYVAGWPTAGPGFQAPFTPMGAWGIPAVNTLILLSSGVTVTWAHWGLIRNDRRQLALGLAITIALGLCFITLQAFEYLSADFTLKTGIYGTTFYMLTGFHGLHVTLGVIMLVVILSRVLAGHFAPRPQEHFGFAAVTWYWHFVDVVWLLVFVFVYWL